MKTLFARKSGTGYLFIGLFVASLGLIYKDVTSSALLPMRDVLNIVLVPARYLVEGPYTLTEAAGDAVVSRSVLLERLEDLEKRNLQLTEVAHQIQLLQTENDRIRELVGRSTRLSADVVVAEMVGTIPSPDVHQVVIDKGTSDGMRVGLAVLDSEGLFGQIIEVSRHTSRVLLISDVSHAVPVEVTRHGLRGIAAGTGRIDRLLLENLPATADVRQGDLLVSSGLGGRFPQGYPVGRVQSVRNLRTSAFVQAIVKPVARLDRSRYLLVVSDADVTGQQGPAQ